MALKVFNLQCDSGHVFEGWFSSHDNFHSQQEQGLLTCPVCDSTVISKKLSAPRINRGHTASPGMPSAAANMSGRSSMARPDAGQLQQLQAQFMMHLREMVRSTEDVGDRFASEARRMHEGEIEERAIRGTATAQERESLLEDGVSVQVIPDFLDDDRLQ